MRTIQTEVIVIGGGATGTGVLRDLAMRGFRAVLVEKRDLTHGTSGRYHGLLHSGGRYAVKDPKAARECIRENTILRRIMPQCIEDTGGFFVVTPWDDPGYAPRFVEGCRQAGIPLEEVPIAEMLRREPLLNPKITHCFRVPDASADSFLGAELNAESARSHGAQVLTYHPVTSLVTSGSPPRVTAVVCHDLVADEEVRIDADFVVNAAGAWSGKVVRHIGIEINIVPGKGVMVAMNHRIVNTVINRCRPPTDGDILVPAHTVSVIGTTDVKVADPDHFGIEPWEVHLCLEEGDKMIPGFKDMRMLRAWAGVRPLVEAKAVSDTREVTRAFVLLDHEQRDGVAGIATITSGKWTTYRQMAEQTVDLVAGKLGTRRECRTHLELLPDAPGTHARPAFQTLGHRLEIIEAEKSYGDLVCECELATREDVERAIVQGQARTIDDIRRDVRLGMGPCQGGFCTFRVAGILHELGQGDIELTNAALRDFLLERWKGLLPVLWGQQLRQERLDELIYLSLLNADHLPGPHNTPRLKTEMYAQGDLTIPLKTSPPQPPRPAPAATQIAAPPVDVLIMGAGLAGMASALPLARSGKRVRIVAKGWGTTHWHTGCIDVLGYLPQRGPGAVKNPAAAIQTLAELVPGHPYAIVGLESLDASLSKLVEICNAAGYPLIGSLERNYMLPTALGVARPTCLAPITMVDGDMARSDPMLIVGFEGFPDFYPRLIADNLIKAGIPARGISLSLPSLGAQRFVTARVLAERLERALFRQEVVEAVRKHLQPGERVGFPAVLGIKHTATIHAEIAKSLDAAVFEIPTLPPSIPGMRLHNILVRHLEKHGVSILEGSQVVSAGIDGSRVRSIVSQAAARDQAHHASHFVLATGGILGGGSAANYQGGAYENIFGFPLDILPGRSAWFRSEFLDVDGHALFKAGIRVDSKLRPVDAENSPLYENLSIAGSALNACDPLRERSLEGIALASGYSAGNYIAGLDLETPSLANINSSIEG